MSRLSRVGRLIAVAVAVAVVSVGLWSLGQVFHLSLVRFAGLMTGATTFAPLPADTFVLAASKGDPALVIGLLGGTINAIMVLIERRWILILVDHPAFARFVTFFDDNRLVNLAERQMFLGILIGGATFIPFEPFRLLAVLKHYPPIRYGLATFISRGGRYYVLALAGEALLRVGFLSQALWLSLGLFLVALARSAVKLLAHSRRPAADSALLEAAAAAAEPERASGE